MYHTANRSTEQPTGADLKLVCPVNFRPEDKLQRRDAKLADGLVYLAHTIIMRRVTAPRSVDKDGFVPLQGAILKQILGHRRWPRIKRAALAIGLAECNGSYRAGERSMGYRLLEPYRSAKWERRSIEDRRLAERIECWRKEDRRRLWGKLKAGENTVQIESVAHLWRHLQRIRIDMEIGERLTRESMLAAELIRQGAWRIDVDDYGRVHTNITNLKRTLRKHLSVDGSRLVNCDVANSQPLFLGILMNAAATKGRAIENEGREDGRARGREGTTGHRTLCGALLERKLCGALLGIRDELGEFLKVCERGAFYGQVAAHLDAKMDYNRLKQRVLTSLYDRSWHRNRVHDALQRAFPGVMRELKVL